MTEKEHDAAPRDSSRRRLLHRGFLVTLGTAGLAAADALFGSAPDAFAASCGCCNLAHCPATTSYSHCRSVHNYTWVCSPGGTATCACCEVLPGNTASGYYCWAV